MSIAAVFAAKPLKSAKTSDVAQSTRVAPPDDHNFNRSRGRRQASAAFSPPENADFAKIGEKFGKNRKKIRFGGLFCGGVAV